MFAKGSRSEESCLKREQRELQLPYSSHPNSTKAPTCKSMKDTALSPPFITCTEWEEKRSKKLEIGPFHFHRYINLWLCFVFLTKRCNTTLLDSLTSGFVLLSSSSYCTLHLY
uniref:Uncharacterized protein n=1 Tax=Pundamilia nyererei TaxID=303518 RepID=A0A3B4H865_9CICH